jgi:hypothetical protein
VHAEQAIGFRPGARRLREARAALQKAIDLDADDAAAIAALALLKSTTTGTCQKRRET